MPAKKSAPTKTRTKTNLSTKKWFTEKLFVPVLVAIIGCIGLILAAIFGSSFLPEKILEEISPTIAPSSIVPTASILNASLATPKPQITPFANISGDKIFFVRNDNFYMMSLDGATTNQVIKNPEAFIDCPSISPDGEELVFTSNVEGHTDLYVIKRDGSSLRNLTRSIGYDERCGAWSPDQKQLLFWRDYSLTSDILLIDIDGKNEINLTDIFDYPEYNMNIISDAPWSPDQTRFVFQSNRDSDYDIYVFDIRSRTTKKIVAAPRDQYKAAWSPNADRIVYTSDTDQGGGDIFVLDLTNAALPSPGINVTNNPAHDTNPMWSPDGNRIVFISDRNGNREIYIMDADGANIQRLTNTPDKEEYPQWVK